ncbi:MAG: DUF1573 domain-containing protein [Bacteroidales bacterium]|nr:DUF1573 domain-containing protein [Bacteroidales bacterium]
MKRILFSLVFITVATLSVSAQNKGAFITTKPDTVKLGEIGLNDLSDENGKVQISVINTGNQPLILNEVTGCCGTNIKEWPKAPILPGKSGLIKVEFRIEPRPQVISRTVTIKSNATNSKIIKIPIQGVVIESKAKNEIKL